MRKIINAWQSRMRRRAHVRAVRYWYRATAGTDHAASAQAKYLRRDEGHT